MTGAPQKRRIQLIVLAAAVAIAASVIGGAVYQEQPADDDNRLQVMATFYPLAYLAEEIGGEHVTVATLVPPNTEIHAWQPTTSDILAADDADVLIYNGAHLDHWFEDDVLPALTTRGKTIVETTANASLRTISGQADPHTWVSPHTAAQQAHAIYEAFAARDPANASDYADNWAQLQQRFTELDGRYQDQFTERQKNVIFVTHAAYGYLAERYGFEQQSVIGLSGDEQPSTSAIASLVDRMEQEDVYTIYVDPVYSDTYADTLQRTLRQRTGREAEVLELYLMLGPVNSLDYFEQMEANLENLKRGLDA
ncbi:MAG: metal ABC transporter substrate-binding protein [Thermoplasmatota archaeon]